MIESVTPAPVVTFHPVIECVPEDAAHAVSTLVTGYTAAAPAGACAVSSPTPAVRQIVAVETTQDLVATPVCAGDIGFDTRWEQQFEVLRVGDRHYEGQLRVLHSHENPDDFKSGVWIPFRCFQPNGKARVYPPPPLVRDDMIPRTHGVVQRRGPGALNKYWAQERGNQFGRDQIDNFFDILAEISS